MIRAASAADPLRVAVLVSGRGSNLGALIEARLPAVSLVAVASSRPGVGALERARSAGLPHAVFPRGSGRDDRLGVWLEAYDVELVVLAGFMELLGPAFVERFCAVNVHPSLLPAFPGRTPVDDSLGHGVRVTGVTVHLVDAGLDSGPILLQEAVPVLYDDTADVVRLRIHAVEHRLLPHAVALLAADRVEVLGRSTRIRPVGDE